MLWPKPLKRKDQEHMAALPWAELPKFYKSIPNTEVGNALRFLIFTGSRTKELRLATWAQIDPITAKASVGPSLRRMQRRICRSLFRSSPRQ